MKIDFASLAFGHVIKIGGGTPNWATSLGQGKGYKINNNPGIDDFLKGMVYTSVPLSTISSKIGKGGRVVSGKEDNSPIIVASVFKKVFVNDILIEKGNYVIIITRDTSHSHEGRLRYKYGPSNTYTENLYSYSNEDFWNEAKEQLGLADEACFFVYDLSVKNQDELVLRTIIVNPKGNVEYKNSDDLHKSWDNLIKKDETDNSSSRITSDYYDKFNKWINLQVKPEGDSDAGNPYSEETIATYIKAIDKCNVDEIELFSTIDTAIIDKAIENEEEKGDACKPTNISAYKKYREFATSYVEEGENPVSVEYKEPVYYTGILPEIERNRIVFGAPGTGKSWKLKNDSTELLDGTNGTLERVTFHPDYSYAQFVGTYKPVSDDNGDIRYEFVAGPFMRVYIDAIKSGRTENPQPHILLIEEINRANVAAVFGDVFQLLDRDEDGVSEYEIQASQDVRKYLAKELGGQPEQWDRIKLPDNMFIWATMNSADQGVYPMDTAFKRRWDFTYLGIDDSDEEIRGKYVTVGNKEKQRIEWNELRKAINEFLADDLKINEDKLLGPYFISENIVVPADGSSEIDSEKFSDVFKNKVLMYLFEDAAKQKRQTLFEGSAKGYNRYSKICEAFDEQGIGIFNAKIQSHIKVQDITINGYELDENGMVKTEE